MEDKNNLIEFIKENPFPTDVIIETVHGCNLRCSMCPYKNLTRAQGKMTFDLWKKIIDEVAEVSPSSTIWPAIMGEPLLLQEDLFEYIKYAKSKGIKRVCLNTNFLLFKKEWLEPLFDSALDEIIIGVDGVTKATYEKIRVGGDFDKLLENIDLLVEGKKKYQSNLKITLQMVIQEDNAHEEEEFIQYWKEKNYGISLKLRYRLSWGGSIVPYKKVLKKEQAERTTPCLWLLRQMSIHWDGKVTPCDSPGSVICGEVTKQSLLDVWQGELKKLRQQQFEGDYSMPPCNKCSDWQAGRSQYIET